MAIDEELLRPNREYLALLREKIAAMEYETMGKIARYRKDDPEYAEEIWLQFKLAVEPMRREIEAVVKVIVDYYATQPLPPHFIDVGESRIYR